MSDLTQYTKGYDPATDPDFDKGGGDFKPLPPGEYPVYIDGVPELKETKKKRERQTQRGLFMSVCFKVMGGEHNGRLIFGNINLDNDNQVCVDIGKRELAKLGMAIGLPKAPDATEQLANARLIVKVKVDGERNSITDYKSVNLQQQVAPAASVPPVQQAPAPQAPPANTGPMPWQQPVAEAAPAVEDDDNIPF
jgi:hypothetical protein